MTPDYYRVLNVPHDASLEAIHSAYRAMALQYHPDRNSGPAADALSSHMVLVNEAYACLGNPSSRKLYDRSLRIAEPLALQTAVLGAADQILGRSGWRPVELGFGDKVFKSGSRAVAVRFVPVLDDDQLNRWVRFVGSLFARKIADWAVVLAYRLLTTDAPDGVLLRRRHRLTVIDLIDSRAFGAAFPDAEYKGLFQPFLIE